MTEVKPEGVIEKVEDKPRKPVVLPEYCSWTDDDDHYVMEVYLPGAEKDTIRLKVNEDTIFVVGETDSMKYDGVFGLCCPIDTGHIKSVYKNGLLRIEAPYLEPKFETIDVKIE